MVKKNRCGATSDPIGPLLNIHKTVMFSYFWPKMGQFLADSATKCVFQSNTKGSSMYVWLTRKTQNQRLQWANYFWLIGSGSLLGPRHWFLSLMVKGVQIGPKGIYMVKNSCGDRFRPLRPIWTTIKHWQDRRESHLLNQYHTYNTKGVEKIKMEFKSK